MGMFEHVYTHQTCNFMNIKWEEVGEDHNCYDFDKQENMNLRSSQKKHEKKK
jgi:hypothetical protein